MAALLKKRALAEYCSYTLQEDNVRPIKKLQIVKRNKSSDNLEVDLPFTEGSKHTNVTLHSLLALYQLFPLPQEMRLVSLKKLLGFLQEIATDSDFADTLTNPSSAQQVLVSKLFSMFPKLVSETDVQNVLDKILNISQLTNCNFIISHGIHSALTLCHTFNVDAKQSDQLLQLSLKFLKTSSNYLVKVRCLEVLGGLYSPENDSLPVVNILSNYCFEQDNRVRTASLNALYQLHKKDFTLPAELYDTVCHALDDDYQCVREAALYLIEAIAAKDPDRLICLQGSEHHIRLVDHAFSLICNAVNDVSVRVRTLAVLLLGSLPMVSDMFLHQTLDKKLMSNMRKRCSAHERAKVMASSGEWSSGKIWAEDIPKEEFDANSVQIISNGACGAFVHGLEDEFLEVRTASLESISKLARKNSFFANQCLDFLVDMFNDEIEDVRLKAIQVLHDIAYLIKLRSDQLDEILHALKDSWLDIRENLHNLLAICRLSTTSCINAAVSALLDNLRRYPQDKRSIHKCLKQMGINHPELILALVPQLLSIHPYFDGVEPSVQDSEYICKLILILNAASQCSTILPLLEEHTLRHYAYLRDSIPSLVPQLKLDEKEISTRKAVKTNTKTFLSEALEKVAHLESSNTKIRLTIYSAVYADLEKLADIDPDIAPAATMSSLYIHCMYLFTKILSSRNWLTPSSLSVQQSGALKASVDQLLKHTLKLKYGFSNLTSAEEFAIRSLRLRMLALQLVYVVHGSTGSALGLCDNFLEHTESLQRILLQKNIQTDLFLNAVIQELSQIDEPRPGAVARILQPLLLTYKVIPPLPFPNPSNIKMAWAEILEPAPDGEIVYKLGAGLVVGVQLDAELWHIPDLSCLRIRITYPDHASYLVIPSANELRSGEAGCVRLLKKVLISAQVWSEACQVGISLVLDFSEQESLSARRHSHSRSEEGASTVQLCNPVKVLVWPKQIRKGI